jgi:diguanylate cyclase (GGDEF)-like protein
MKRKPITFQELLEKVLPLEELPHSDRLRVQRALRSGVAGQLEAAALMAIEQLEALGALRRLPGEGGPRGAMRFQPRDAFEIITLHLPKPAREDGIVSVPRSQLPTHAPAGLNQVRRLLRLDDPMLASDPRLSETRAGLVSQLELAGHELMGSSQVRFFPAVANGSDDDEPLDTELAQRAMANPQSVLSCPDLLASERLRPAAKRLGFRSAVIVGVISGEGAPLGHLEVRSREPALFQPDDLARAVLLADFCAGLLERAARIEKLVFIDALTGAYNRSYFDLQVQNEMARAQRENGSMAVCIVDIDDFKRFNTTFGYEAGNQVLVQVAHALRRGVRPFDTVARWGGEEFVVLLTAPVFGEDVLAICERLRSAVERMSLRLEGLDGHIHQAGVTVSVGVALFPDHAQGAQELWRVANQALLEAKRPPKNQVVFHLPRQISPHQR